MKNSLKGLLYSALLFTCVTLYSQPINNLVGDAVTSPPNAASMGKYGDIPVNPSTGTASVNIPIYSLSEGSAQVNLNLSYHGSGIKVGEVADWVGTGWTLFYGGIVSRTVLGLPDDSANGYYHKGDELNILEEAHLVEVSAGTRDAEPDIFQFTAGNISGKFFFDEDESVHVIPSNLDIKVEVQETGGIFDGFIITTPQGIKYTYGKDFARVATQTIETSTSTNNWINSWMLLKISSHDNVYDLIYEYDDEDYSYKTLATCSYVQSSLPSAQNGLQCTTNGADVGAHIYMQQIVNGKRLKTISSNNTLITFHAQTIRLDLDSLLTSSPEAKQLDSISIQTGSGINERCMGFKFSYDYFEDPNTDFESLSYSKRLRLDSLQEISCDGSIFKQPYKMFYEGDFLPHRLNKGIDHWGYYNGEEDDNADLLVLTPSTEITTFSGSDISYGCAKRNPSIDHMGVGMLDSLVYPTKGNTVFTFEPHSYPGLQDVSTEMDLSIATCGTLGPDCCGPQFDFLPPFSFTSQNQINSTTFDLYIQEVFMDGGCSEPGATDVYLEISDGITTWTSMPVIVTSGTQNSSTNISLSTVTNALVIGVDYTFTVHSNNGRGQLDLNIMDIQNANIKGSGMRIKEIKHNDPIGGAPSIVKNYEYKIINSEQTSGFLMRRPQYVSGAYNIEYINPADPNCSVSENYDYYVWTSQSITPLSDFDGRHLVYSRVVESVDGAGQTVYNFNTDGNPYPTIYVPTIAGALHTPSSLTGPFSFAEPPRVYSLSQARPTTTEKQNGNNSNTLISSSSISSHALSGYEELSGDAFKMRIINNQTCNNSNQNQVLSGFITFYKPRTGRFLTGSKTTYLDGVTTTTSYVYDQLLNHHQPISESMTNSDNEIFRTKYFYPIDYDGQLSGDQSDEQDTMKGRNLILPPWKIEQFVQPSGGTEIQTGGSQTIWSFFNNQGDSINTVSNHFYPRRFEDYEMTFNISEIAQTGDWVNQGHIEKYEISRGKPKELFIDGWANPQTFVWSNTGRIKEDNFISYKKEYIYFNNSDLVKNIINIDGTSSTFTYDDLFRLKTSKDNDRDVTSTYTYGYPSLLGSKSYIHESTSYLKIGDSAQTLESRTFVDGLGRELQTKLIEQAPDPNPNNSIVVSKKYDEVGRIIREYEPVEVTNGNNSFQNILTSWDYTEIQYEDNPLSRKTLTKPPDWTATTYSYGRNNFADAIKKFRTNGNFGNNLFYRQTITDPNNNKRFIFTDKRGREVLSRVTDANNSSNKRLDTYTLYDDKERVFQVLPPDTDQGDTDLIFTYLYYGNDLISTEDKPDCDPVYFIYNDRELPSYRQDGKQKLNERWYAIKYDLYGRSDSEGWRDVLSAPSPNEGFDEATIDTELIDYAYGTGVIDIDKLTQKEVQVLNSNTKLFSFYQYDNVGRLQEENGGTMLFNGNFGRLMSYGYDSQDNIVTEHCEAMNAANTEKTVVDYIRKYDHIGREIASYINLDNSADTTQVTAKKYNAKELLTELQLGISNSGALQTIDYAYKPNRLLEQINDPTTIGGDLFGMKLFYDTNYKTNLSTRNNGDISGAVWRFMYEDQQAYEYKYDFADRLEYANYELVNGTNQTRYSTSYTYYNRGQIKTVCRNGGLENVNGQISFGHIDSLHYSYVADQNQIQKITDNAPPAFKEAGYNRKATSNYDWEENGNMKNDPSKESIFQWNFLNEPNEISIDGTNKKYVYFHTAEGELFRTQQFDGTTLLQTQDYIGPRIEYRNGDIDIIKFDHGFINNKVYCNQDQDLYLTGNEPVDKIYYGKSVTSLRLTAPSQETEYWGKHFVLHEPPFKIPLGHEHLSDIINVDCGDVPDEYEFNYFISDQVGRTRVVFKDKEGDQQVDTFDIIGLSDYYPFGGEFAREGRDFKSTYGYMSDGHEEQNGFDLGYRRTEFRFCDPWSGSWAGVDVFSDIAPEISPYRIGLNNPILYEDPFGLFESKAAAKEYAKENGIKTGLFRKSKIRKQADGSFAIENSSTHSITQDLGGDLGVQTGISVAANDVVDIIYDDPNQSTVDRIFNGPNHNRTETLRDGTERRFEVSVTVMPEIPVGPGGVGTLRSGIRQIHHIIPRAVFRDLKGLLKPLMSLNSKANLKKLPVPFHGNHPQYSTFVRNRIIELRDAGKLTAQSISNLQKDLRVMINEAKSSGKKLNDYFRQFN